MGQWRQQRYRLNKDHQWKAKSGYKIFVADRGAVRFDIPRDWLMLPKADTITFLNRPEPDDDCRLQLSIFHLPDGVDWSAMPLPEMVADCVGGDDGESEVIAVGRPVHVVRRDLELAWAETRFIDPGEKREARSRTCMARSRGVQAVITLDYWPEDDRRFLPVWDEVLRSLRLAEYVDNPLQGAP